MMFSITSKNLQNLIQKVQKHNFIGRVAIFDPGETTGFSVFERTPQQTTLLEADQFLGWPLEEGAFNLKHRFARWSPDHVVYETYHVYKWRLQEHTFSEVPTIQIIGALKFMCIERGLLYSKQTALTGKSFCTDSKLKYWGFYLPGLPHARDSIRHGCQFLLFGSKTNDQ